MPVLILTSENKSLEEEIGQSVAQKMGYDCLTPDFLTTIAQRHDLEVKKINQAMTETPSLLGWMSSKAWNYYLSCVEYEVLNRLMDDNIVCWGLSAQLYVILVSHVLKARLIGGQKGDDMAAAKKAAAVREQKRDRWGLSAFNRKESDSDLYDMVINLDQIKVEEVVDTLVTTLGYPRFKPMTYSKNTLADKTLAARVKNVLLKSLTDIRVDADNGTVVVTTTSVKREKNKKINAIKELAGGIEGVGYLEVHWNKDIITEASTSFR